MAIMLLLLCYCVILSSVISQMTTDLSVRDIETYIFFNNTHCLMIDYEKLMEGRNLKPYFSVPKNKQRFACDNPEPYNVVVPCDYGSNFKVQKNENNNLPRVCKLNDNCNLTVQFNILNAPKQTQKASEDDSIPKSTQKKSEGDSYLYTYIGVGVAVIVLIVLFQMGCIVSYSRKVANTRRALENVLNVREEKKEANDRYSVEPISKKATTTAPEEQEDIYESLEHLPIVAAKGNDTIKSMRNRPPMPLPHEMLTSASKSIKERPPMPLPNEMLQSDFNAKTLPHKNSSKREFFERSPEPPWSATMTVPRKKTNIPQHSPVNTLQNQSTFQQGSCERIPKPPLNTSMTSLRVAPTVLPKNASAGSVNGKSLCYPANQVQLKNNALRGSTERFPNLPLNKVASPRTGPNVLPKNATTNPAFGKPPCYPANPVQLKNNVVQNLHERFQDPAPIKTTPPRVEPSVPPRKPAPVNMMSELNSILSKKQNPTLHQTIKEKSVPVDTPVNEQNDSSDEEWTYEELPPIKQYLR